MSQVTYGDMIGRCVRNDRWKLHAWNDGSEPVLSDLNDEPLEVEAANNEAATRELQAALDAV